MVKQARNFPQLWLLHVAFLLLIFKSSAQQPLTDPCLSHLSCQTCSLVNICVWCPKEGTCVTPPKEGEKACRDATSECNCSGFKECGTCLTKGYCGWCQDSQICYSLGAKPSNCFDFHESVCSERLSLSTEYAILIAIAALTVGGLILAGIILLYKRFRDRTDPTVSQEMSSNRSSSIDSTHFIDIYSDLEISQEASTNDNESDSLLSKPGSKKASPKVGSSKPMPFKISMPGTGL